MSSVAIGTFTLSASLERESLGSIVGRIPAGWMSQAARRFAIELTCYNLKQLREIAL
jgi:hypothetical protein